MDDYYELLGVESDAARDEIRTAYRDRKAALDASTESGKAEAAELNKAWNVLSDPYQRGRYDERLAQGEDAVEDDDVVVADAQSNGKGRPAASRPAQQSRQRRPAGQPTLTPPDGTRWPQPKQRIIAMVIDLIVLFAVVVGAQLLGEHMAKSQHPAAYKVEQQLNNHTIPDAQKAYDNAKKASDAADKANAPNKQQLDAATKTAKDNLDALNKQLSAAQKTLGPWRQTLSILGFVIGFLYLAIPSAITGRTLGKRLQRLKVVRENGAPLGPTGALLRYGLLVGVTFGLSFILGPLAAAIVIIGVTMWMRNPNMQGLHDRWTHTIVVADAS
jgi:uncharacterized RDD family membrane protein YckC